ncbi:TonB-dependent receptor [Paludibacter sp. 221]|uniref:SusC/RagA family TonB-linked outer membrane protein n=1 Tax=Paludibacter sp. 221 TaxID=2302939 RepID=UPI0013D7AEE4|nr:TonB-dependent receptor [Paludibacter sp. 221]NDV46810.1 TonB-dependent receptor [Paludibacter sp. 221]
MKKSFLLYCLLLFVQVLFAQNNVQVAGVVIGEDDNLPVIGANVVVKGATQGTITDFDGNFELTVPSGSVLSVSFIGYQTFEQKITASNTSMRIVLKGDAYMLDEVVAIGYGTMKKSDLTGAVSSVKADQLQKTPAAGLDQALQGRVAGVTVNSNTGQPGAEAEVRIRGIGTVNNSSPLYVVDGVMVSDIKFLNPNDIESTEILKDASATAIYGSRGANGVILVTTKQGKEGKSNISFNAYWGVQNRWRKLDLMKRDEFASTIVGLANYRTESQIFNEQGFGAWLSMYRLGESPYYPTNFDYSAQETDWQDEVFNSNALIHNYNLSISGGTDKSAYAFSASYFNQDGTIIGSNYERLTLRFNSSFQVRKWLKIGENLSFMSSRGRNAMNNNASPAASVLSAALAMAPWAPTHYPDGSVNSEGKDLSGQIAASSNFKNVTNPFSMVENSHPESIIERWVGDIYMEITPIKNLVFRSDLSLDLSNNRDKLFKNAYEYSSFDKADKNYLSSGMSRYSTLMIENTLTYSNTIGKHSFSGMIGQTAEEFNYYNIGGSGASILNPVENNWYLNQTTEDRTEAGDGVSRARRFSLLGRLHYSYASRYMITANFRADASSKFPENLWGYFPSTALAWRISEESFMDDFDNLDNLKLRAGWGQIGNDKIGDDSFILKVFNSGPTFVDYPFGETSKTQTGATVLTWVNSGGKWETTEQLNIGVDFGFWNGLLSGNVDLYQRDTKEMLLPVTAPAHVGNRYDAVKNVGTVRNQGIEIALDHSNKIGKVSYNIGGNVSFVRNELTALNGGAPIYGDVTVSNEGLPLYTFWGYNYLGIYKDDTEAWRHLYSYEDIDQLPYHAGDAKFEDISGPDGAPDGKIDDYDKTSLGNPFPWLTYGVNLGAEFYGVDIQLFFQGVYGNEIYNKMRVRTEGKGTEAALGTQMRDAWTVNNQTGTIPNPYGNSNNYATSSRFVESGAYFRLKNVQVGYTIPKKHTEKLFISRCRLYVTANNLFTITKYTGYDPEVGGGVDYGNYPQSRTFMFGINMDF